MRIAYTKGWDSREFPNQCHSCKSVTTGVGIWFSCHKGKKVSSNKCDSWEAMPRHEDRSLWGKLKNCGNIMVISK